ncbi:MAG: hypothetical protein ACRD22_01555 [Terriglobia bacterium]
MENEKVLAALCLFACAAPVWSAPPATLSAQDVIALHAQIARQQEEIEHLEKSIAEQQNLLDRVLAAQKKSKAAAPLAQAARPPEEKPAPISIAVGNARLTPFGFVDATLFGRSTNTGSGIGTNFGGIPYSNSAAGSLSEINFSGQNSRLGLRVDSTVHGAKVLGYFEADFLGSQPGNAFVTSNSNTFRMRNVFVDLRKGRFEVLGGQDWSLATPNRNGLSPLPSDIFYTQNMDTNYQAGLVWARQTQFRFTFHPNDNFAVAVSLENPQQYIGGSGGLSASAVKLPSALAASLAPEFNNGTTGSSAPNLRPDIIVKAAYDAHPAGRHLHVEAVSLTRSFKDALPTGSSGSYETHLLTTESGEINANLELFEGFRLIANTFFGSGNGRYVFGLAPDVMVRPDGTLSPIHTYSTVDGFEANLSKSILLYGYYGGIDIARNAAREANGNPVGYGFFGSPASNNRTIQEATFGFVPTIWKRPDSGALSLILQYSYLTRTPWYAAPGAPRNAHASMYWVGLRYTIP